MKHPNRGLYSKYEVYRTDRTDVYPDDKHFGCEYFVLDVTHDPYAERALLAYADECEEMFPILADDLRRKIDERHDRAAQER